MSPNTTQPEFYADFHVQYLGKVIYLLKIRIYYLVYFTCCQILYEKWVPRLDTRGAHPIFHTYMYLTASKIGDLSI